MRHTMCIKKHAAALCVAINKETHTNSGVVCGGHTKHTRHDTHQQVGRPGQLVLEDQAAAAGLVGGKWRGVWGAGGYIHD